MAVVTDSTTYLPAALLERWSIEQVSLYVGWEGDLRPEHEYEDLDSFYARLHESPLLPTTSQPSVGTSWRSIDRCSAPGRMSPRFISQVACRARARAPAKQQG